MDIIRSINRIPVRLTDERWVHIIENHDDLAGYYDEVLGVIEAPDYVIKGYEGALIALKKAVLALSEAKKEGDKFLAVVYKELSESDGFVITAYFTSKIKLEREVIVWQRQA